MVTVCVVGCYFSKYPRIFRPVTFHYTDGHTEFLENGASESPKHVEVN
jgi:hypothetical protein